MSESNRVPPTIEQKQEKNTEYRAKSSMSIWTTGTVISRLRTDHKDDSLLAEGHCRPLDRAESKWQTVTRLLGLHTDCELFLLWWRAHSAAKQSWSIHANFNNRPTPSALSLSLSLSLSHLPLPPRPCIHHPFADSAAPYIESSIVRSKIRFCTARASSVFLTTRAVDRLTR